MHVRDGERTGLELRQITRDPWQETGQVEVLEEGVPFQQIRKKEKGDGSDAREADGGLSEGCHEEVEVAEGDGGVGVRDGEGLAADVGELGWGCGVLEEALLVEEVGDGDIFSVDEALDDGVGPAVDGVRLVCKFTLRGWTRRTLELRP